MQLVAYGAQDIYLTGNPQITFFKVVYRRHTNFSMESIEQTWNGSITAATANRVSATISRNGDLVGRCYLEHDPGETNAKIVKAENNIKKFKAEIAKDAGYKKRIAELEGMNSAVENRNQEVDLRSKVARLKRESGLNIYDLGKQLSLIHI